MRASTLAMMMMMMTTERILYIRMREMEGGKEEALMSVRPSHQVSVTASLNRRAIRNETLIGDALDKLRSCVILFISAFAATRYASEHGV